MLVNLFLGPSSSDVLEKTARAVLHLRSYTELTTVRCSGTGSSVAFCFHAGILLCFIFASLGTTHYNSLFLRPCTYLWGQSSVRPWSVPRPEAPSCGTSQNSLGSLNSPPNSSGRPSLPPPGRPVPVLTALSLSESVLFL